MLLLLLTWLLLVLVSLPLLPPLLLLLLSAIEEYKMYFFNRAPRRFSDSNSEGTKAAEVFEQDRTPKLNNLTLPNLLALLNNGDQQGSGVKPNKIRIPCIASVTYPLYRLT